jgi:peptidoglycan-associated lipoprotein
MRALSLSAVTAATIALAALAAACGPKYPKCNKDDQCADHGEVCVEGSCQKCRDDKQCKPNEQCKGGRCEEKPECASDSDCKDNKVCKSGRCQVECSQDSDCASGSKCASGRCKDKLSCAGPSDCGPGSDCVQGRCQAAQDASRDLKLCEMPTVYFEFNEFKLSTTAKDALSAIAPCLKDKGGKIRIEGHCDERGTEEFNLVLGENRARTVLKYLSNLGVSPNKLDVLSKGKLEPADPGHTEEAWAKNRRSVLIGE